MDDHVRGEKPGAVPGFTRFYNNLLSGIYWPTNSDSTLFLSDAAGHRIRMTTSGEETYSFLYDTTSVSPAVVCEIGGGSAKLYIRAPYGRLIAQAHIASGVAVLDHYYHFDALGSTIALTDEDGDVTDTFSYDAWGNVTRISGSTQQPYLFVGRLGYYTNYQDPMLSPFSSTPGKCILLQLGVRYYDPSVGRFTQRDSVPESGVSDYAYCGNSPCGAADPSGLEKSIFYGGYTACIQDGGTKLPDVKYRCNETYLEVDYRELFYSATELGVNFGALLWALGKAGACAANGSYDMALLCIQQALNGMDPCSVCTAGQTTGDIWNRLKYSFKKKHRTVEYTVRSCYEMFGNTMQVHYDSDIPSRSNCTLISK